MKPAAKTADKGHAAEEGAGKKSSKMLLIVIILLVVVIAGGGAAAFLMMRKPAEADAKDGKDKHAKKEKKKSGGGHAAAPLFVVLDPFTVNLQGAEGDDHFLQIAITLQVETTLEVDALKAHMPQIRNRLLMLLSSKKPSDVLNTEGKKKLAEEIKEQVNHPFEEEGDPQEVHEVFFTSLIVQ